MPSEDTARISDERNEKILQGWRRCLPFFVYKHQNGWKLQIFPAQFLAWLILLAIGGYLAAGTALFLNDRLRNELDGVSWFDRVYPPNWPKYRAARGLAYIKNAEDSLEDGDFSQAFHQLRVGLARVPEDKTGRILLADMMLAAGRVDLSENTLAQGVQYHATDLDYMEPLIRRLMGRNQDSRVIEITSEVLENPETTLEPALMAFLSVSRANALYFRGHFDQAEEVLRDFGVASTPDGQLLSAKIEWDRGFRELAMAIIGQLNQDFPRNLAVYRTQVKWLIEMGLEDRARRESLARRIQDPTQPQPRIDLLYAYDKIGDEDAVVEELESLLADFPEIESVVLQIGDFAANVGRPLLAQRVVQHAQRYEMNPVGPALMEVEALIVDGQYQRAVETARGALDQNPTWEEEMAPVFNGLQAIAFFALGDREEASLFLNSYLGLKQVRAENLVAVANRLNAVGATSEARRVLVHAVENDPLNQAALTRLIEFDLEDPDAPDLPARVEHLLTMRRSSPELLRNAYDRLGEDRYLFARDRNSIMNQLLESLSGKSRFSMDTSS